MARRIGNNGNGGKKGRSGRKPRSIEQAMVEAFQSALSPRQFGEMTEQMLRMFYDAATVQDEEGKIIRLKVDATTRARIWEKVAAYAMGEPIKRVQTGAIGDLQAYLAELMDDGETGDAETGGEDISASWIHAATLD